MAEKTESVRVPRKTMRQYRKLAKQTGYKITYLIDRALCHHLTNCCQKGAPQ